MGIIDKIKALRGNESQKQKYSFDLVYRFLSQEHKAKLYKLIADYNTAPDEAAKNNIWFELGDVARERLAEAGISTDKESCDDFIITFSNLPNQSNYLETVANPADDKGSIETQVDTDALQDEANTHSVVTPRRFPPPQPIAEGTIITPDIISAQQRGLGVTANPGESSAKGEEYLKSLIEEAKLNKPATAGSDVNFVPHPGDKPQFEAKNDSVPGGANIDWIPPDHTKTIHPKPPEHLVK